MAQTEQRALPNQRSVVVKDSVEARAVERYTLFDRILHWFLVLTFVYLMLSGLALGYARMAWLYDILGGGQSVRFVHPIVGVLFTVGTLVLLVAWLPDMKPRPGDWLWTKRVGQYIREGHVGLDIDKYNAGQKGYFWFAIVSAVVLFVTGIPMWFPTRFTAGPQHWARVIHHVTFLATVGGFIVHVYMSTAMLPGTFQSMTSGKVTRAWAAYHHPRWFRREDRKGREAEARRS